MDPFTKDNFQEGCRLAAAAEPHLQAILDDYGYPPFWVRPNTFETLVLTILEQQVSLASAYAAYRKLKEAIVTITPESVLQCSDDTLRGCYFSRQKIGYVKGLASALHEKKISLRKFAFMREEEVRSELKKLKGIGDWTVDIYLVHALRKTDILPVGDLALVKAVQMKWGLPSLTREALLAMAEPWRPYRTFATMLLWHYYIKKKNIRLLH